MSKIGEKPIIIPSTVQVEINNNRICIKGKEGELKFDLPLDLSASKEKDSLLIKRQSDSKKIQSLHGLYRSLIFNAIVGVERPWQKKLEVVGTGYSVRLQGEDFVFKLGFSHPVIFKKVPSIKYTVEGNNKLTISGIDKQLVGEIAYQIKILKKPDVYKGKGIKYEDEKLKIKPGKKVKTAETATA